jgi:hypothetical protein
MYSLQQSRNNQLILLPRTILMAMIGTTIMLVIIQLISITLRKKLVGTTPLIIIAMIIKLTVAMENRLLNLQKLKIR